MSKLKKKKQQHISDYKIVVTYPEENEVKFEDILNGEEFKQIVQRLLIEYS